MNPKPQRYQAAPMGTFSNGIACAICTICLRGKNGGILTSTLWGLCILGVLILLTPFIVFFYCVLFDTFG